MLFRSTRASDGAFDVTVGPLLDLWKQAGREKRLPTADEIAAARANVGWKHFELLDGGARRLTPGAKVDLGGIAKKYGIDQATAAMRRSGIAGGLVNVGGDIRVFGVPSRGKGPWRIEVRDPFNTDAAMATIELDEGAVCTSGNYERFVIIDGRRRSHIVDPRSGQPADMVPSVTVVGPTALEAGLWATALSILGPDGLELMKRHTPQLEAIVVTGDADDWRVVVTPGLPKQLKGLAPVHQQRLVEWTPSTRPAATAPAHTAPAPAAPAATRPATEPSP